MYQFGFATPLITLLCASTHMGKSSSESSFEEEEAANTQITTSTFTVLQAVWSIARELVELEDFDFDFDLDLDFFFL